MIGREEIPMPAGFFPLVRGFFPLLLAALLAPPALGQQQVPSPGEEGRPPARFAVSVRMMSGEEITRNYDIGRLSSEERPERLERRKIPTEGVAGVFVGPLVLFSGIRESIASAVVVGPPHSLEFQSRLEPVRAALVEFDFAGLVADALRERAPGNREGRDGPEGISVAIAFYGLRSSESRPTTLEADDDYCLVAVGSAFALASGGAGQDVYFTLGTNALSPGMEAPICDSFLNYSERGAYRLAQVMQQSAAKLADWLVANVLAR
jgi:hypothetical protein